MITGASATSRIRIIPGQTNAISLTAERAALPPQTANEFAANFRLRGTDFFEAALRLNWRHQNSTLLSYS